MELEKIEIGAKLVKKLKKIEDEIKEISKTKEVGALSISNHQSGSQRFSYEVTLHPCDGNDFLHTIRSLILDKLKRDLSRVNKEIEDL